MYFAAYRPWDRFRTAPWQRIVRNGLVPVTAGLIIASGTVMARVAATGLLSVAVTVAAALLTIQTRVNPFLLLAAGGLLGRRSALVAV
jgi:chromate transporter